jgi:hypothetical protein
LLTLGLTLTIKKYPLIMERLAQLIGKLNEQFAQNADPFQLLVTTQLIETELVQLSTSIHRTTSVNGSAANGSSKVAVVMPASNGHAYQAARTQTEEVVVKQQPQPQPKPHVHVQTVNGLNDGATEKNGYVEKEKNGTATQVVVEKPKSSEQVQPVQIQQAVAVQQPVPVTQVTPVQQPVQVALQAQADNSWNLDPLREIPTLAHQQSVKELNEVMASKTSSLNEKLKAEVKEVAHVLNDAPVRDLRRAIGINDRFVFISELFRNDEVMYERSIKTINSFRILPEAQYWIERELKVKLGWDENKESTRHFYQLVKRRFS